MKIGVDIRSVCGHKTGKGWYTHNLVKNLLALDKNNEYILYTNAISGELVNMLSLFHKETANTPSVARADYKSASPAIKIIHKHALLWHMAVIKDFEAENGDLFFAPTSFVIPALLPENIKSIMAVHDLIAFVHPRMHHSKAAIIEWLFLRKALKKTSRALVPSNNTKKDLARIFKYSEEKISVTPLGVDEVFFKKLDIKEKIQVVEKYNLPENFILTVSGLEPRKNVSRLVDAFLKITENARQKPTSPHKNLNLIIIGGKGWKSRALQEKIARINAERAGAPQARGKIIHIENCAPQDLPAIYKLAQIFVYPSIYEGFGLPPLEALAAGCPVVCSNAASLPEVCGSAALYINPENTKEIAAAITKLLNDEKLRAELAENGKTHAEKFSWSMTAKLTLKSFSIQ